MTKVLGLLGSKISNGIVYFCWIFYRERFK